jgi:hypothetical protein
LLRHCKLQEIERCGLCKAVRATPLRQLGFMAEAAS